MPDKGKFLVSTKANAAAEKTFLVVVGGLPFLSGLVLLTHFPVLQKINWGRYLTDTAVTFLGTALITFLLLLPVVLFCIVQINEKSYCAVYEHAVEGRTCLSRIAPHTAMQSFHLLMQDIIAVEENDRTIVIHTKHNQYEVMAVKNRGEAAEEIRKRIQN